MDDKIKEITKNITEYQTEDGVTHVSKTTALEYLKKKKEREIRNNVLKKVVSFLDFDSEDYEGIYYCVLDNEYYEMLLNGLYIDQYNTNRKPRLDKFPCWIFILKTKEICCGDVESAYYIYSLNELSRLLKEFMETIEELEENDIAKQ